MSTFRIRKEESLYKIREGSFNFSEKDFISEASKGIYASEHSLFLSEAAFKTISKHIGYGKNTDDNQAEQGGLLLGKAMKNKGGYEVLAEAAIPAFQAEGSMKHLHFSHDVWHKLLSEVDKSYPNKMIVGWYHTHPLHLRVYMSDTDLATQAAFFCRPFHFAVVINPQKKIIKAFAGERAILSAHHILLKG